MQENNTTDTIKPNLDKHLAIKAEGLTKIYPLYKDPKDRMKEALHPMRRKYHKEFYALRDVSFSVEKGDSLGIIGQNGSGKSTLLKILSRVLTPTAGNFQISGRVISLLELGSGFNPDLTGLENIYFYGTILGFSKSKIETKLDEIIAFADIGQFIYQPLKTYSSGMRSRLAFSVASHVDPDILILDEVLAVGDLRFRQKCFRIMQGFVENKKTIILVSHDTNSIINFCNKALWLNEGEVKDYADSESVAKKYVGFMTYGLETDDQVKTKKLKLNPEADFSREKIPDNSEVPLESNAWTKVSQLESFGKYGAIIEKLAITYSKTNTPVVKLKGGERLNLFVAVKATETIHSPGIGLRLKDKKGNGVFTVNNYLYEMSLLPIKSGSKKIFRVTFKLPLLVNGKYTLTVALSDGTQENHTQHHWIHDALILNIDNPSPEFKRTSNLLVIEKDNYSISTID